MASSESSSPHVRLVHKPRQTVASFLKRSKPRDMSDFGLYELGPYFRRVRSFIGGFWATLVIIGQAKKCICFICWPAGHLRRSVRIAQDACFLWRTKVQPSHVSKVTRQRSVDSNSLERCKRPPFSWAPRAIGKTLYLYEHAKDQCTRRKLTWKQRAGESTHL